MSEEKPNGHAKQFSKRRRCAMEIITRAEARARGLKRYFTGRPCKHGHISQRWTIDMSCVGCKTGRHLTVERKAYMSAWKKANLEKLMSYRRSYYSSRRESIRSYRRARRDQINPQQRANYAQKRLELLSLRIVVENLKSTSINLEDLS